MTPEKRQDGQDGTGHEPPDDRARDADGAVSSTLEWVAAATGLLLTLAVLGLIVVEIVTGNDRAPPSVMVEVDSIARSPAGYIVEVRAVNGSEATAATVQIEGRLKVGEATVEQSQATIDFVPGFSERRAGLLFTRDPRLHELEVRATGYARP